mgnify:CR=1 FL=1
MTKHNWVLDVLEDLEVHLRSHELIDVADEISRTKLIARWEIQSQTPLSASVFEIANYRPHG